MAYKYFSQQLLTKNLLDLSEVFPQKQQIAKEQNNVAYNLGDIVLYDPNFKVNSTIYSKIINSLDNMPLSGVSITL